MELGLIKWYDSAKGFGVLITPEGQEVFLHHTNWMDTEGISERNIAPLIFEIGEQRNKITALKCTYFNPSKIEHWEKIFSYRDSNFSMQVEYSRINFLKLVFSRLEESFDVDLIKKLLKEHLKRLEKEPSSLINFIHQFGLSANSTPVHQKISDLILSKIDQLSSETKFKFWKEEIIDEYLPEKDVLLKHFQEISTLDFKRLDNVEIQHLILLRKINYLKTDFQLQEFLNFQDYLEKIEHPRFLTKIISDLENIAHSHYLSILKKEIESLINKTNLYFHTLFSYVKELPSFLSEEFKQKIKNFIGDKILETGSFNLIVACWEHDFLHLSNTLFHQKIIKQDNKKLISFLNSPKCDEEKSILVFDELFDRKEYFLLMKNVVQISSELVHHYDRKIHLSLDQEEYIKLWKEGIVFITPLDYIYHFLDYQKNNYEQFFNWVQSGKCSKEEAISILKRILSCADEIDDRFKFYKFYFAVKYMLKIDSTFFRTTDLPENEFLSLILWHLQKKDDFNLNLLKRKFNYFHPEDQVMIFKRLFYLKHVGKINFDLESLDEIIRADLDLFLLNQKFSDDFLLDISTHVIIECMKAFVEKGDFVFESDLILKDLKNHSQRKFKIGEYFDKCEGRMTPKWNWKKNGRISIEELTVNGKKYTFYKVEFKYDKAIVKAIKKLPYKSRRYYPDKKYWGVSLSCKEQLMQIAETHKLFIELPDKKHYSNNLHLIEYSRFQRSDSGLKSRNIPEGITFCEGRKAKNLHKRFQKEFWWCKNQECFQNCIGAHNHILKNETAPWKDYTLFDFLKILGINLDEHKGLEFIKDGHYPKFLGHINAFNRLVDHLYCEECENLLYPVSTSHFALYRDVWFHCINENCSKKHQKIYLNHCLYGECKFIIDSRISKRCNHGMLICSNCGSCCSEDMFKRRLVNLQKVGDYIHPDLIYKVENKLGHLEKAEYYCYQCSGMMTEINKNKYTCQKCDVTYELDKFKWLSRKWTETHRRRKDYSAQKPNSGNDEEDFLQV